MNINSYALSSKVSLGTGSTTDKKQELAKVEPANTTTQVSKAERIKSELAAGTYKIDIGKTAQAVADTLI